MTGMAALAMCAAFTSCSKDTDFSDVREQNSQVNYETAFVSKYGQIASNQDWGFGQFKYKGANARMMTRSVNVNGNLWSDHPTLGATESNDVMTWVNDTKANLKAAGKTVYEESPVNLKNYWVTQVYKGTTKYTNQDGQQGIVGSDHMNHLVIKESADGAITDGALSSTGWYHVNNFNAGNNTDWWGNTLVLNSGTLDFAYHGTEDSKYHNRWIIVPGSEISAAYKDYYYVCFDFEASVSSYTNFRVNFQWTHKTSSGSTQTDNKSELFQLPGSYTNDDKEALVNALGGKIIYEGDEITITADNISDVQAVNGNQVVRTDNIYTDWIIRLVKANPDDPTPTEPGDSDVDVRVLAEDLDVTENYSNQTYSGDFDFNDVVFDVVYDFNGETWIILRAAGGTWPIFVDGNDVHAAFGEASNVMINTQASGGKDGKAAVKINLHKSYTDANNIPVTVTLPNGETRTLTAGVGLAPHKLAVDPDFTWMRERRSIEEEHPNFSNWVKDPETKWYGAAAGE